MIRRIFFALLAIAAFAAGSPKNARAEAVGTATLTWTAPGDDSLAGTASLYDIRYSFEPINDDNFPFALRVAVLRPSRAGRTESFTVTNLLPGFDYYFAIRTADDVGNWSRVSNLAFRPGRAISLETVTPQFGLSLPWPNPVRDKANFTLTMPHPGLARVEVFDAAGRLVERIVGGQRGAGTFNVGWTLRDWRGNPVGAGLYLIRARLDGDKEIIRRVTVVR